MFIEHVAITTDASGDGSAVLKNVRGLLRKIYYKKNDYADGMDFTITDDLTGEVLFTGTNVNASAAFYPTADSVDEAGGARLYAASGEAVAAPIPVRGTLTVTVSDGGNAKSGDFYLWVEH